MKIMGLHSEEKERKVLNFSRYTIGFGLYSEGKIVSVSGRKG